MQALAKELWAIVGYPLGKPGFRKTIEGRAETDYLVAMPPGADVGDGK